jgi:ribosomal-protein-alanine N-acetyltransferase
VTTSPGETTSVRIRPAVRADVVEVLRIERSSFGQPWPYNAFLRFLDVPGFLVAVDPDADDGRVVGYIVADEVQNRGQPLGHVKDLAVHPDRRGEGIGGELLARSLAVLDTPTVKLEVRESNDPAQSLYRDFDFRPLRQVPEYYDDGEDAVIMIREGE